MTFTYQPLPPSDAATLGAIAAQCFVVPNDGEFYYMNQIGVEHYRVLRSTGSAPATEQPIVGGLCAIPMGQWFGGKRVDMAGIASVCIAPEWRGKGAAVALMQEVLSELYDRNVAISSLYPAVPRLYRQMGYEQGGTRYRWELACDRIQMKSSPLAIQTAKPNLDLLRSLQQRHAKIHAGHLDRAPVLWESILDARTQAPWVYTFGAADAPEGYVVFQQANQSDRNLLIIKDWALTSAAALQTFWAFLASHRSQIDVVQWHSGLIDPLITPLPELRAVQVQGMRWMTRLIHVPQALEQRGYPMGLSTELYLRVEDEHLPGNQDSFCLTVEQGLGQVQRRTGDGLHLNSRGLAALYTGLFSPDQLQWMGLLDGSGQAKAIATQLFAGPSPWLPDFF